MYTNMSTKVTMIVNTDDDYYYDRAGIQRICIQMNEKEANKKQQSNKIK